MRSIYLAGPEVFLAEACAIGEMKKELCAQEKFKGLFPLDAEISLQSHDGRSKEIFNANVALIRACDAIVANLTPFRSVSADVGTVFEVGFALALAKPVFAYTTVLAPFADRVVAAFGAGPTVEDQLYAADGMRVEDFRLVDNLMIAEAIRAQGWGVVARPAPDARRFSDLDAFAHCLRQARAFFDGGRESAAAV